MERARWAISNGVMIPRGARETLVAAAQLMKGLPEGTTIASLPPCCRDRIAGDYRPKQVDPFTCKGKTKVASAPAVVLALDGDTVGLLLPPRPTGYALIAECIPPGG